MTNSSTEPRALGVAVIGYSFMGKAHSNAWRNVGAFYPQTPPVRQQVLVGRDAASVETAAARYGWRESATDWRAVIARDDVDIVDICTPGSSHAEIALAALAAGKHVLVEKPLANDLTEAVTMVAAANRAWGDASVHAMVGFNYRRIPALVLARRLLAQGRLGEVRQVRLSYLQDWLSDADAPMTWRLRRESAGSGVIGDLASHAVDQLTYLLGQPIATVSGSTRTFVTQRPGPHGSEPVTVEDAAWATLQTDGGVVASLEVSRMATGRKNALQIELYGERGAIRFDLENLNELWVYDVTSAEAGFTRVLVTESEHPYLDAWWPTGHILGWDHTFTSQAADFLSAIASGTPSRPTFADGLAVQQVLAAIESSAAQGGVQVGVERAADETAAGRS